MKSPKVHILVRSVPQLLELTTMSNTSAKQGIQAYPGTVGVSESHMVDDSMSAKRDLRYKIGEYSPAIAPSFLATPTYCSCKNARVLKVMYSVKTLQSNEDVQ